MEIQMVGTMVYILASEAGVSMMFDVRLGEKRRTIESLLGQFQGTVTPMSVMAADTPSSRNEMGAGLMIGTRLERVIRDESSLCIEMRLPRDGAPNPLRTAILGKLGALAGLDVKLCIRCDEEMKGAE